VAFIRHVTLTANTVNTTTFTGNESGAEILSRNGLAEVYVSVGDTTTAGTPVNPTIAGNDFDVIPATIGSLRVRRNSSQPMVIKLISAAATTVTIRAIS
jgi:hypothetical protein